MSTSRPADRVSVSPGLFRLLTDCIRLRCDAVQQLRSPSAVVDDLLGADSSLRPIDQESLLDHFAALQAAGELTVYLGLAAPTAVLFDQWMTKISDALDRAISREEGLSALLFIYRVEVEVSAAMATFTQHATAPVNEPTDPGSIATNVVAFPGRR